MTDYKFKPGDRVLVTSPPDCPDSNRLEQAHGSIREYAEWPEGHDWPFPYIVDLDEWPEWALEERDGFALKDHGLLCGESELWPEDEPLVFVPFSVGDVVQVDHDKWPVFPKGTRGVVTMVEPDGHVRVRPEGINFPPEFGGGPVPFSYWASADSDYLNDLRLVLPD